MKSPVEVLVVVEDERTLIAHLGTAHPDVVAVPATTTDPDPFLHRVIHEIGDAEKVSILGPSATRLALEREYVATSRRPDRLHDVELR